MSEGCEVLDRFAGEGVRGLWPEKKMTALHKSKLPFFTYF